MKRSAHAKGRKQQQKKKKIKWNHTLCPVAFAGGLLVWFVLCVNFFPFMCVLFGCPFKRALFFFPSSSAFQENGCPFPQHFFANHQNLI
jgi:hypothetical protein